MIDAHLHRFAMTSTLLGRYLWQKALHIFVNKAIRNDFSNQTGILNMLKFMQSVEIPSDNEGQQADGCNTATASNTDKDDKANLGICLKLGARGRMKVEASLHCCA